MRKKGTLRAVGSEYRIGDGPASARLPMSATSDAARQGHATDLRVLLAQPSNLDEPVIVGVLDGFADRPERSPTRSANLALVWDEAIRVEAPNGNELLELRAFGRT